MSFFDFLRADANPTFDEIMDDPRNSPSSGDGGASIKSSLFDDVMASIDLALPDSSSWFRGSPDYQSWSSRVASLNADVAPAPKTAEATASGNAEKSGPSLLDKIGKFADKNKTLTEVLLRGVSGAVVANQQKSASSEAARNRIAELQEADRIKQADNARISASVSGLRSPGIIARQMPLRRIDGTPVFKNGRIGG